MRVRLARHRLLSMLVLLMAVVVSPYAVADEVQDNWPQWRGPLYTGESPAGNPPIQWSELDGQRTNIRWKTPIEGLGHSTPIVWGDRIFVTSARPTGAGLPPRYSGAPGAHDNLPITHRHIYSVFAIRRSDGEVLWQRDLTEALPHEGAHNSGSLASNSPVTDGERVYVCFGSRGLFCLDFDGHLLWQKQLGVMQTKHGHGEGASPVLSGDTLIINRDHEGPSFIVALDKRTGEERWRNPRNEVTSWSSPIVIDQDGRRVVIVSGTERIRAYSIEDGAAIWECGGLSHNVVASPVYGNGLLFAGSSYETRSLMAIRLEGATGDITDSDHVIWKIRQRTPYVPSPLLYRGSLFFLRHYQGILTQLEATTGREIGGPYRLGDLLDIYASPVAAAGRIYITGRNGTTMVIRDGDRLETLATNVLEDTISASAAIAGKELFLRGERFLYCIAEE
jgi:outer membrane protein assembly factor BamB